MRFWQVFKAAVRLNVQNDLAYRGEAMIGVAMAIFWVFYELASIGIIFRIRARSAGGGSARSSR